MALYKFVHYYYIIIIISLSVLMHYEMKNSARKLCQIKVNALSIRLYGTSQCILGHQCYHNWRLW